MSKCRVLLLLPLLCLGRPVEAQNLTRLKRMWQDAARASSHVDSVARLKESVGLDTVIRGNLVLLAPPTLAALSVQVADTVWAQLFATYGEQIKAPGHRPLIVALYGSDNGPAPYGFPPNAVAVPVPIKGDRRMVPAQAVFALVNALRKDADKSLDRWIGGPIKTNPPSEFREELYEDLVTSPSLLARSCYVGSLSACEQALGLVPTRDPATEWYDAAARREVVRNVVGAHDRLALDCEQGVDAACIRLLRGPDSARVSPPLMFENREVIVRLALRRGGPKALQRLLGNAGLPLGRRLELASGTSLDSLVHLWQAAVLAHRPASVDLTPGVGWVALAWTAVLGVLVLRSSRWRF